jgi:hypothetical protein
MIVRGMGIVGGDWSPDVVTGGTIPRKLTSTDTTSPLELTIDSGGVDTSVVNWVPLLVIGFGLWALWNRRRGRR